MRAVAAACLLALTAAAPLQADLAPAATCTLGQPATEAAFRALVLLGTEDDTEADERGTIYTFAGADIWGDPAKVMTFSDYANPKAGEFSQRYETRFVGEMAEARARLLAAHGKTKCDREIGESCELDVPPDGAWRRSVSLSRGVGLLLLTCDFSKG